MPRNARVFFSAKIPKNTILEVLPWTTCRDGGGPSGFVVSSCVLGSSGFGKLFFGWGNGGDYSRVLGVFFCTVVECISFVKTSFQRF